LPFHNRVGAPRIRTSLRDSTIHRCCWRAPISIRFCLHPDHRSVCWQLS
jgi:hypothetical protein